LLHFGVYSRRKWESLQHERRDQGRAYPANIYDRYAGGIRCLAGPAFRDPVSGQKNAYSHAPLKRIIVQLLISSAIALLVIIVLTEILNWLAKDTPVPLNFYTNDIFIFLIWFLFVNGIYVGLCYYQAMHHMEGLWLEDKKIRAAGFLYVRENSIFLFRFQKFWGSM
jgi:hypothetical protein